MRHLNVPLDDDLYQRLRAEAERTGRPATRVVREAIVRLLEEARREAIHEGIVTYAAAVAGSRDDLDPDLEETARAELLRDGDAEDARPAVVREAPRAKKGKRRTPARRKAKGR
jgi:predicted transcriptional regulator